MNPASTSETPLSPTTPTGSVDPKWSDDTFLDRLRQSTDDEANGALEQMRIAKVSSEDTARLFRLLTEYDSPLPDDTPPPIRAFLGATRAHRDAMVEELDLERIRNASTFFRTYATQAATVMLASSLPSGYAAPCLTEVLTISEMLDRHPYRRLMGVIQMLVSVAQGYEDLDDSQTMVTAQKLRLLHAGVRSVVPKVKPDYAATYGSPVNHEDMLATLMGFSYLVVEGLRRLRVEVSDAEAEDFWYAWRQYARLMGIYPAGQPLSEEFIPQNYAEAATFYASYVRRQFVTDPAKNPQGVKLTKRNLELMRDLIPWWLRLGGFAVAPRLAMQQVLGKEGLARVGVSPVTGHRLIRAILRRVLGLSALGKKAVPGFFSRLSVLIMQDMIDDSMGGRVTFLVPMSVRDMQTLSEPDSMAVSQSSILDDIFSRRDD